MIWRALWNNDRYMTLPLACCSWRQTHTDRKRTWCSSSFLLSSPYSSVVIVVPTMHCYIVSLSITHLCLQNVCIQCHPVCVFTQLSSHCPVTNRPTVYPTVKLNISLSYSRHFYPSTTSYIIYIYIHSISITHTLSSHTGFLNDIRADIHNQTADVGPSNDWQLHYEHPPCEHNAFTDTRS